MLVTRFTGQSAHYLGQYLDRIRACLERLDEDQVWWRPGPASNSIGNLLLHLHGNLSLWLLKSLGGEAFERHRSAEFTADRSARKGEMLAQLAATVERCQALVASLDAASLERRHPIQAYDTDGLGAVFHVVEHMSYHTGQIVWITKQLEGERQPIDFYPQHRNE